MHTLVACTQAHARALLFPSLSYPLILFLLLFGPCALSLIPLPLCLAFNLSYSHALPLWRPLPFFPLGVSRARERDRAHTDTYACTRPFVHTLTENPHTGAYIYRCARVHACCTRAIRSTMIRSRFSRNRGREKQSSPVLTLTTGRITGCTSFSRDDRRCARSSEWLVAARHSRVEPVAALVAHLP